MVDPFLGEKIQNWASEFAESDAMRAFCPSSREHAATIAQVFLDAACKVRGLLPNALGESDLRAGLMDGVGKLVLPPEARAEAPLLCAACVEVLQVQGRLAPGRTFAPLVRALRSAFARLPAPASDTKGKHSGNTQKLAPIVRPAAKVGPNDPCPCGSGRKFKKCCQRLLG